MPVTRAAAALCFALLTSVACGAAGPSRLEATAPSRPSWIGGPSYSSGGAMIYNGLASGAATPEEARRAARQDALLTMAQEVAVEVGGEIATRQVVVDDQESVDVQIRTQSRTRSIHVEGVRYLEDYGETWRRGGVVHDAWALVAVPIEGLRAARCEADGRLLLAWSCDAEEGVCGPDHELGLREALGTLAMPLLPETLPTTDPAGAAAAARSRCAARVAVVRAGARFLGEHGGEFFAEASASVRFLKANTGEELAAFEVGPVKGGHYSRGDALRAALARALEELRGELPDRLAPLTN